MENKRIKKLKMMATLKEKRHYLLIKIAEKSTKEIRHIIEDAMIRFLGILGYAKSGPKIISITNKGGNSYIIISVTTKYVDAVKASIALIKEGSPRCIGVSGTIKKVKEKFLK